MTYPNAYQIPRRTQRIQALRGCQSPSTRQGSMTMSRVEGFLLLIFQETVWATEGSFHRKFHPKKGKRRRCALTLVAADPEQNGKLHWHRRQVLRSEPRGGRQLRPPPMMTPRPPPYCSSVSVSSSGSGSISGSGSSNCTISFGW